MTPPWRSIVNLIANGENIDRDVTNRPLNELADRTQYLKDVFDAAELGQALVAREQPVTSDTVVGTPVYYNTSTETFSPAKAAVDFNSNGFSLTDSSRVVGIVSHKYNSTLADILMLGLVDELDLTTLLGADYASGQYFLSSIYPGRLVSQKPEVGIYVCTVMGTKVLVNPTIKDVIEDHIHYRQALEWVPQGTVSITDGAFELADINQDLPGWLPAGSPIFEGNAPDCAKFGYNISADPELAAMFPASPEFTAYVELNGVGVMDKCLVNQYGIWWLTDLVADCPWPSDFTNASSSSSSSSSSECVLPTRTITLWYTKMVFKTNNTCVIALAPDTGSPISFVDSEGNPASSGCLFAKLEDLLTPGDTTDTTGTAIKSITDNVYVSGPVVTGVAGGNDIVVSGTDIGDGYKGGLITISRIASGTGDVIDRGAVEIIALDDARKEILYGLPAIEFLNGRNSRLTCKTWLGSFAGTVNVRIGLWVLGKINGNFPALSYSFRTIPDPTTATAFPQSDTYTGSGDIVLNPAAVTAYNYQLIYTPARTVLSNDLIMFTISRASSDGYAGNISIVNMFYELRVS